MKECFSESNLFYIPKNGESRGNWWRTVSLIHVKWQEEKTTWLRILSCTAMKGRLNLVLLCLCFLLACYYLIVVVDSHIRRVILVTEETTVTHQVSHGSWQPPSSSQRGTKVKGSHHDDNLLLRSTGIQIVTKRYAAPQALAPTNIKTVLQTSLLHLESNLDRLGLFSPTNGQRSQQ